MSRSALQARLHAIGRSVAELPEPPPEARALSGLLRALIAEEMEREGGAIPFRRFMELALYAPGLGYYSAGSHKLGAAGDFVTAPEISPLFGRTLARPCAELLAALGGGEVLEVGAGTGRMAADVLAEMHRLGTMPERYLILELSAELRERQALTLQQSVPELAARVHWLEHLPERFQGVILANELLDALPVHLFWIEGRTAHELYVSQGNGEFSWRSGPWSDPRLPERIQALEAELGGPLADGYVSEINLAAEDWMRSVGDVLERGLMLLIDYGHGRREYYHPQRDMGTLLCHYRHRAHGDPLILPGLQDITAHVDFTAVAEAGTAAGLELLGYTTQANFLLGSGLTELLAGPVDAEAQLALANEVRRLTLPQEMGETFKVISLGRGELPELPGFRIRDLRDRL